MKDIENLRIIIQMITTEITLSGVNFYYTLIVKFHGIHKYTILNNVVNDGDTIAKFICKDIGYKYVNNFKKRYLYKVLKFRGKL